MDRAPYQRGTLNRVGRDRKLLHIVKRRKVEYLGHVLRDKVFYGISASYKHYWPNDEDLGIAIVIEQTFSFVVYIRFNDNSTIPIDNNDKIDRELSVDESMILFNPKEVTRCGVIQLLEKLKLGNKKQQK
ncbi:hypothetical protein FQA39_LY19044 [Lamprigera yunnana]|nr:hypothetical protein FQA39_LY19044 [Lamprigera yunnana]